MSIQRAFCSFAFLDEIIRQRKSSNPHKIAFELLKKLCDIYVDVPKPQIEQLATTNDVFKILLKRENRSIRYCPDVDKQKEQASADDLFFLTNLSKNEAKKESIGKGLFVVVPADIHLFERVSYRQYRPFNLAPKELQKNCIECEFEPTNSWQDVFDDIDISPINAAVITDNFMFNDKFDKRCKYSLYPLLKSIVPSELNVPFHLTIFLNRDECNYSKEQILPIVEEIKKFHLCDNLLISIVAHTKKKETHDREILTNYHYVFSGRGFSIIDKNGVQEVARGEIKSVYHNIAEIPAQTTVKHLHTQALLWLRQIYLDVKQDSKRNTSGYTYIVGDDFENRLLIGQSI